MKTKQKGFGAIEILIVLVIACLIGGAIWYVVAKKDKTQDNTASNNQSNSQRTDTQEQATTAGKYLEIKEWGVKMRYTGEDTLSYYFPEDASSDTISITSAMAKADPKCKYQDYGRIFSYKKDDIPFSGSATVEEYYNKAKADTSIEPLYGKAGDMYFEFATDYLPAQCAGSTGYHATEAATEAVKDAVLNNMEQL